MTCLWQHYSVVAEDRSETANYQQNIEESSPLFPTALLSAQISQCTNILDLADATSYLN